IVSIIATLKTKNSQGGQHHRIGGSVSPEYAKIKEIPDSISIQGITIKNLFKSQILAHQGAEYDSLMIVEKVYQPHQVLWDNCYGMIFGEENASKFNNPNGMVGWNRTLYPENKAF